MDSTRRQLVQMLQSLSAAGVTHLPRGDRVAGQSLAREAPVPSASPRGAGSTAAEASGATPPAGHARTDQPTAATLPPPPKAPASGVDAPSLDVLRDQVAACTRCDELAQRRTQTVFGVGDGGARLCLLGEAPGADEDRLGEPFVGRAGQLLDRILAACGLSRDEVYILNTLKCRPPGNRNPTPAESANCRPFLLQQLELIDPDFICCLGAVAAQNLLETTQPIGRLRGRLHSWGGAGVICTYHPAYLLRNPAAKAGTWEDMQMLMRAMGTPIAGRS